MARASWCSNQHYSCNVRRLVMNVRFIITNRVNAGCGLYFFLYSDRGGGRPRPEDAADLYDMEGSHLNKTVCSRTGLQYKVSMFAIGRAHS